MLFAGHGPAPRKHAVLLMCDGGTGRILLVSCPSDSISGNARVCPHAYAWRFSFHREPPCVSMRITGTAYSGASQTNAVRILLDRDGLAY